MGNEADVYFGSGELNSLRHDGTGMTGIFGWYTPDQNNDQAELNLQRMAASTPQPGDISYCAINGGGMGGRFPKLEESVAGENGVFAVVDGEPKWTDNRASAIARMQGSSKAVLAAYTKYGERILEDISGRFSIAIIDCNRNRVILAIDRMGSRPLCYSFCRGGGIVFGSTTKTILSHSRISTHLSPQAIYDYVYFHVIPSPATIFSDISKLEPSQSLSVVEGRPELCYFWTPTFSTDDASSRAQLSEQLVSLTRSAVQRCEPDSNTATFLSGGLDSSTISGIANEFTDERIKSYSIGFAQEGYDEMEYARIAANHFDIEHHEYYVTPDDIADSMVDIVESFDEPFGNSSVIPVYFCAKVAQEDGVKTLLAGDGGDELFAGNERYERQRLFERYSKVPQWLRSSVLEPVFLSKFAQSNTLSRKIGRYIEQSNVPMPERFQTYNYLHMNQPTAVFTPGFVNQVNLHGPLLDMQRWYDRKPDLDLVDRMLYFDWKLTLADNDLRKVNRVCELAGTAVKYPFLDDDLVDFSTRIPTHLKLHGNELRYFFKKAFSDYLPAEVLTKEKHGFGLPFGHWLNASSNLQNIVYGSIERLGTRNIFERTFIDQILQKHSTEHAAFYGNIIWILAVLDIWLDSQFGSMSLTEVSA